MEHRLRFAPEILARLGEELVPHPDLGIMELVRNAYDADARTCRIQLSGAGEAGGTLVVSDDGEGMTAAQLASGFLLIGRSGKAEETHTASGRRKVGEKGLGRLAALRLGTSVTVRTRSGKEPQQEHSLIIDWERVDASEAVEDVPLAIESRPSTASQGTEVEISGLRQPLADKEAERLARSLLMLTGPFADGTAFRVTCDTPEFDGLTRLINDDYLEGFEYRLVAILDEDGQASATLYNWRGEAEYTGNHADVGRKREGRGSRREKEAPMRFFAPAARLEMWMFNLNPRSKEPRFVHQDTNGIRRWLGKVGGVHLYHRGLRVQPYGDEGNDWLGINLRRSANPELRPSTNTSVGRILVEDPDSQLTPKTDRSGFVDALPFLDLRDFAKRAVDWSADVRLHKREQRRVGAATKARERTEDAETRFKSLMEAISPGDAETPTLGDVADRAVLESFSDGASELFDSQRREIEALREDLLLYRTLATVGTSTAVFAHEAVRPAARIINEVKTVGRRIEKRISADDYERDFQPSIDASVDGAKTLESFAKLPLSLLEKNKRDIANIEVDTACQAVVPLFKRYLDERRISVEFDLGAPGGVVHTTVADIESVLSNLIANAAHAFTRDDAPPRERIVRVGTRLAEEEGRTHVVICVDDSGPGIAGLSLSSIWLPGKTTRDNGTGLGLTIVRDIVADLKGRQQAWHKGELGGARIMVWLPVQQADDSHGHADGAR
ncbi:sensor histidine kinase [Streptomyces gobiensis]|uniref:sensor histidine kinase n=1 Tax=Streptomyces gobiensis TaxID=2875706 RepID=UPI001E39AB35|nr:sensor histidine kinase [Streptomyces gobiensis]UGY90775.1 ATP-binding protein [Streptomyces gobiensis]